MSLKMLEWHCGIGGASAAMGAGVNVLAAVDINRDAIATYALNFPEHGTVVKNIESLTPDQLARWGVADLWWMSPPCQPHTVLGKRLDMADPRSASLANLLKLIELHKPANLAMENVPGFATSVSRDLVVETLTKCDYTLAEEVVCPSRFGWPNRRERYYLAATRDPNASLLEPLENAIKPAILADFVNPAEDDNPDLIMSPEFLSRYQNAIHIADRLDETVVTNCFTSAYGRSPTRCGSYLWMPDQTTVRRFSPREVLRLLNFPARYQLPDKMTARKLWPLTGNSLTLGATRRTLSRLPLARPFVETAIQ